VLQTAGAPCGGPLTMGGEAKGGKKRHHGADGAAAAATRTHGRCYQGVERESFAYRMLENMGWQEGSGLGSSGQGIKSYIKARKKDDLCGVGRLEADKKAVDWTINSSAYDRILSGLRAHHTDESSDPAEHALPSTSSGKELETPKSSKSKKDRKGRKKKLVRAQGRYQKKEKCKLVSNYSSEDLAAILGKQSVDGEASAPTPLSDALGGGSTNKEADAADGPQSNVPKRRKIIVVNVPERKETKAFKVAVLSDGWWGFKMFMRSDATLLGDDRIKQSNEDEDGTQTEQHRLFTEEDQEKIYTNAHKIGTQNRQGLGCSKVLKISGGNWKGTKTSFDGEDDDGSAQDNGNDNGDDVASGASRKVSKGKLKGLVVQALKAAKKKKMKAAKLKAQVFKLADLDEDSEKHDERFFKVLKKESEMFSYDGKVVKLTRDES